MSNSKNKYIYGLCLLAILSFIAYALIPRDWVTVNTNYSPGQYYDTITVLNPVITNFIVWAALINFLLLIIIGWKNHRIKRTATASICLLIAFVGFPLSCGIAFYSNIASWTTTSELTDKTGQRYYFMDISFLQGQTMALTRRIEGNWLMREMKVLGTNNGDSPRSWASVVRPAGAQARENRKLYLSEDGFLVGIRYDHKCYLAYDTVSGEFYGHGDIENLSPFILIGPTTPMHKPDVDSVLEEVKKGAEHLSITQDISAAASYLKGETRPGYPKPSKLKKGMLHDNQEVRKLAAQLFEIHQYSIEKASKIVSKQVKVLIDKLQSSDAAIKKTALSDLGLIVGPAAAPAIPLIVKELKNEDINVSQMAAQALGLIGEPAIPVLLKLLHDESKVVRHRAIWGLGMAGPAAVKALPDLINALDNDDPEIRAGAAIAFEGIGPEACVAIPELTKALNDEDHYVRSRVKRTLSILQNQ